MATNLLLSFPAIPDDALTITSSASLNENTTLRSVCSGYRKTLVATASDQTSWTIDFDLGASNTQAVDHVAIARADSLQADVTQLLVRRSSNGTTWTAEHTDASFASATLRGTKAQDYFEEIATSSAYRYWRIDYTSSASRLIHSKIHLGEFFDIGRDPEDLMIDIPSITSTFEAGDGTEYQSRVVEQLRSIKVIWKGVTDANAESFMNKARDHRKRFCYLYAQSDTSVLDGFKCIHCEIDPKSVRREPISNNWNLVGAVFKEMAG
jgi:hypothetical protein